MSVFTDILGTFLTYKAEGDATDAKIAEDQQNQRLSEARADDALARGAYQAGAIRMRAGQIMAQQRAGYAASGVDANVGSAADVQASARMIGELDAKTALNNAYRQAWGFRTYGYLYGQEADYERTAGRAQQYATLLGGASQVEGDVTKAASMMAGGAGGGS